MAKEYNIRRAFIKRMIFFCLLHLLPLSLFSQTEKSDSLYQLGMEAFQNHDYKNAEILFRQTWEEDSLTISSKECRLNYSLDWLYHTLYKLDRYDEAYNDDPMPEITPLDRRLTIEIDTLFNQANRYYYEGSSATKVLAEMKFSSVLREMRNKFGDDNGNLGNIYIWLSSIYLQDGNADEAYQYAKLGSDILSKIPTRNKPYLSCVPLAESAKCLLSKKYGEAVTSARKAIEYCKGNMTYLSYQYSTALEVLENACYNMEKDSVQIISAIRDAEEEYFNLSESDRTKCMEIVMTLLGIRWNFHHAKEMKRLIESGYNSCRLYEEDGNEAWSARSRLLEYEALAEELEGNPNRALQLIDEEINILSSRPGMTPYEYSRPLTIKVRLLTATGQQRRAIEEGLSLDKILANPSTYNDWQRKYEVNTCLAHSYSDEGEAANALMHFQAAEQIMKKMDNFSPQELVYLYHSIASAANKCGNSNLFESYLKKVKEIYDNNSGLDPLDSNYFDTCINLSEIAQSKGDKSQPDKTFSDLSLVIENARFSHSPKQLAFPESYLKIKQAQNLIAKGKKEDALKLAEDAVAILEKNGEVIQKGFYEIMFHALGDNLNDIAKAVEISNKMLSSASKEGITDIEYADALIYCADANCGVGSIDKAREFLIQAKEIMLKPWDSKWSPRYNTIMNRLASSLCNSHLPEEAMEIINLMEENISKHGWKEICPACWEMNKLECLVQLQRKEEAYDIFSKLCNNSIRHKESEDNQFIALCNLGSAASRLGRITEAIECYEKAIALIATFDDSSIVEIGLIIPYISMLNQIGDINRLNEMMGDEKFANIWSKIESSVGNSQIFSAVLLPSLVVSTYEKEGLDATRSLIKEYLDKTASQTGTFSAQTALVNYYALIFESNFGSLPLALENALGFYQMLLKNPSSINNNHSEFLMQFGYCALAQGNSDLALEALELIRNNSTIQFDDISKIKLYNAYGAVFNQMNDADKAYENYKKAFELSRDYILDNFLTMTSEERSSFWNSVYSFYRVDLPSAAGQSGFTPRFASLAYDAALFSTGFLLASDINMTEVVNETKDRKIRKAYDDFIKLKGLYEKATEVSALIDDDGIKKASELKIKTTDAEKKLLNILSNKAGNYNRRLAVGWQDVCKSLGPDEAAVEFIELPIDNCTVYIGMVLRSGYSAPVMKRLFTLDKNDAASDPFENCYTDSTLKEMLWGPLSNELNGCSTVWFAPQGRLTVTAIESLPGLEEVTGQDSSRFRRVSSTRELVRFDSGKSGSGAVLYGDIDFSLDEEGMKKAAENRGGPIRQAMGIVEELPGTKEEAEFLLQLLGKVKGFEKNNTRYLNRGEATETSFKKLSEKAPRIVHVGTHGYYANVENQEEIEKYNKLLSGGVSSDDLAMMQSGLLFAGAEGTLFEDRTLPDNIDDGVLTAREIASLKLQGLELTVLSACETALGEIRADGVFGLQRGLKKAGAGAIMMSLWKVSDKATTSLMKSFYSHWLLEGMTKYDALEAAKNDIRSNAEWNHPQFWAPFILLDAFD